MYTYPAAEVDAHSVLMKAAIGFVFLAVVCRLLGQSVPVDPLASLTTADVANGKRLFEAQCAPCHGIDGRGGKGVRDCRDIPHSRQLRSSSRDVWRASSISVADGEGRVGVLNDGSRRGARDSGARLLDGMIHNAEIAHSLGSTRPGSGRPPSLHS